MLENIKNTAQKQKDYLFNEIGNWLDAHPTINKIVVIVNHFFRAAAMYGFMAILPFSTVVNCSIGVVSSLFYRVTIERFCHFRFAIPACIGALAIQILNVQPIVGIASLALYVTHVVWISNQAVNDLQKPSCCSVRKK